MTRFTRLAAIFALFSAISAPAFAVEWNGMRITPRASVSEIYDDNVNFAPSGEIDDLITQATVGLSARGEGKTRNLYLNGNLNYEWFMDNGEFDNTSGDIIVDYRQQLSEYDRIRIRDVFTHYDEPRTFEDAFNRTRGRYSYFRNKFFLDYTKEINKFWGVTGRYSNEATDFQSNLVRDSWLHSAGAEAHFQDNSTTRWLFAYDFEIRDFSGGNSADTHTLSVGVRHYLTKQVYFDGRVGVDFIDSFNGDSHVEPLFRARITDEISETTTFDVTFEKEFQPNAYTEDLFDYWQVSATLKQQILKRLYGYLTAFYGEGDYVSINRNDELIGANVALSYEFTQQLRGNVKYTYTDVSSNFSSQEYTKNTVLLGLTLEF